MIEHDLVQGSPEWLAHRRKHFNASDAPAMLGLSKYKTRYELLLEFHTGLTQYVDTSTQKLFDDGHRFEALARPIAEGIIGQDLYPVVGSEGKYSASFDGLTVMQDINWENKTLNAAIRACKFADDLDEMYLVQMEQQHMVSGADKTLFTGTKFDDEGNLVEKAEFWYVTNLDRRQRIIDGWNQFEKDLAEFVPVEVIEKPKAATIMQLPSLAIQIKGEVVLSNLPEFEKAATAYIANISTTFVTDEDFSNGEAAAKFCKEAEDNIEQTKSAAIAQTSSIDELMRSLDFIKGQLRDKRLIIEKLVKAEKENRKVYIVQTVRDLFAAHVDAINAEIAPIQLLFALPDFAGAISGKKTLSSMKSAVDTVLANSKIEADKIARDIRTKQAWYKTVATGYEFLFMDLQSIIFKATDDFQLLVNSRITEHKNYMQKQADEAMAKVNEEPAKLVPINKVKPQLSDSVAIPNSQEPVAQRQSSLTRPTDEQIIEVLTLHYRVHESKIISWLLDIDLAEASLKMSAEFANYG